MNRILLAALFLIGNYCFGNEVDMLLEIRDQVAGLSSTIDEIEEKFGNGYDLTEEALENGTLITMYYEYGLEFEFFRRTDGRTFLTYWYMSYEDFIFMYGIYLGMLKADFLNTFPNLNFNRFDAYLFYGLEHDYLYFLFESEILKAVQWSREI